MNQQTPNETRIEQATFARDAAHNEVVRLERMLGREHERVEAAIKLLERHARANFKYRQACDLFRRGAELDIAKKPLEVAAGGKRVLELILEAKQDIQNSR